MNDESKSLAVAARIELDSRTLEKEIELLETFAGELIRELLVQNED